MIEPDEIGGRKQASHTPTIALTIALILVLVVSAISFKDWVEDKYEKEFAEKEKELYSRYGYVPAGMVNPSGQSAQVAGQVNQVNANPPAQSPAQPLMIGADPQLNAAAANMNIEGNLPAPADPEIDALRNSLDQVKAQSQRTEERYREITGSVDERAREAAELSTDGIGDLSEELPAFLREATVSPPGGNPAVQEEMERMQKRVRNAPSLAKVTGYDSEWGIVTFNAGVGQGVKPDQRFAVRRGDTILGWIKVDDVFDTESIAVFLTRNKNSETAAKPEVGDDLINFEF